MTRLAHLFHVFGLLIAATALAAPPAEHDLSPGLSYFRVHELPADLPPSSTNRASACVVDVRYVKAEHDAATAFLAWVKFRASAHAPVFVLANAETAAALREPLAGHERGAGVVVVGLPARGFQPDVPVTTTAQKERRAYNAFEQGIGVSVLITDNPDKVRNDEASLSRDRLAEAAADAAEDALTGKRPGAPLPVDATLQRAVHLHRALVALKKL